MTRSTSGPRRKSVTRMWLPDRVRLIEAVSLVAVDHHDDQQERVVPDLIVGRDFVSGLVVPNPLRDPRWLEERNRSGYELADHDGLRGLEELDHLICSLGEFQLADYRTYAYTLEYVETARMSEGRIVRPAIRWEYADGHDDVAEQDTVPPQ
jgi:hypothetical protein